jgi:hypothetical protein
MKQNYFIHNGQKYYTGTKIRIQAHNGYGNCPQTATFVDYDSDTKEYHFKISNRVITYNHRSWTSYFLGIYGEPAPSPPAKEWTFRKELDVNGMLNAWMWYLFLMVITTIFKGNVFYWATISGIFFKYRNEKLRKAGYKV